MISKKEIEKAKTMNEQNGINKAFQRINQLRKANKNKIGPKIFTFNYTELTK